MASDPGREPVWSRWLVLLVLGLIAVGSCLAFAMPGAAPIPPLALVASLLIVGLLLMYVHSLLGRNARVKRLVRQQTAELRQAKENLERGEAERRQAEQVLRDSQALYSSLVENLPVHVLRKDRDGRFTFANRSFCKLLHRPLEEIVGQRDVDFYPAELAEKFREDDRRVMETGELLETVEENIQDGQQRYVQVMKFPVHDAAGNTVGVQAVFWDVTEQKRTAEALRAAKDAAEAANRAKSDFLANMSHEIRTPLNAIIGMTELMLDMELAPTQREYLTLVRESGESLLLVINDILDFSRIEAGRLDLETVPFDLREHLGDTMRSLAVRAHKQGLELACHVYPDVPEGLAGDPGRLRQIVVNLVGNAVKFTEQGEVVLNVAAESRSEDEAVLHFTVADTGVGIPEDKLGVIFEMFEQADKSARRKHGGAGLGLAISSRLVECMGGRIWVESRVGRGTTFHFTARFALVDGSPPAVEPAQADAIRGMRVLVVDDNATNCRILEEMLGNWEMVPASARGADEALRMLQQALDAGRPYRLVITDAGMPDTDGFTLAQRIKQHTQLGSTVIMMLSSDDRPGDVARCEELDIAAYLLKPIKQSELLDAIMLVLGMAHAQAEAAEASSVTPGPGLCPLRVLLAEDSLVNQKLAVGLLARWGHTVTVAGNGHEALAAWQTQPFDLVLMDVQMPDMDGLEAAATIRTREKHTGAHVPIIAMTAHAMKGDRQRCLEAGMDDYVSKPIRAARLFDAIAATLKAVGEPAPAPSDPAPEAAPQAPPEPAPQGGKSVDWAEALQCVRGDRRLLRSVVEALLEELPGLAAAVGRAVADGDPAALRIAAHTLKGSLRYFGATSVYDCAYVLEQMGRGGDLGGASQTLTVLQAEITRLTPVLREYVR